MHVQLINNQIVDMRNRRTDALSKFIRFDQFRIRICPTHTQQFTSPVHVSLARISHQLCSISFYCNCRKFYYYDCSMSVKNRSYEVCICWLREKDARIHSAQQQKYTKIEQVEYEGEKEERRHNASILKTMCPSTCRLSAASVQICPEA